MRRPYDDKGKRFAATIPVDEVRRLRSFLSHRSAQDGWRVVIVDEANDLNVNAANALLKSLEEPPQRTVFLLIASAPGRLLPTIRSRCRVLSLPPLGSTRSARRRHAGARCRRRRCSGRQGLAGAGAAGRRERGRASRACGARAGWSSTTASSKLAESLPRVDWRLVHALSDELQPAAAQARFELFYELLLSFLGRLIRAQATGEGAQDERDLAGRLIGEERLASFAALWERIGREKAETVGLNLDRKALILETVGGLVAAAQDRKPA